MVIDICIIVIMPKPMCVYVKAIRSRKERSMITCYVFQKARNKNHRAKFTPSNLINEEQTDCHIFFPPLGISVSPKIVEMIQYHY